MQCFNGAFISVLRSFDIHCFSLSTRLYLGHVWSNPKKKESVIFRS